MGGKVRIGGDLDAAGMTRVLEHEAGDLTCTVESGIRLSALAAALAPSGQRLSLDPPGDPTIGACLAGNLSGPLRHRFGAPRDLVLGVTLVLADGTIVNAGGKVVKNVAGYDLGKLVCGSRGRLAFIGRVSLRLHPAPAAAATVVVETARCGLGRGCAARARSSFRAPSTSSIRAASPCCSKEAQPQSPPRSRRRRALVGGTEVDASVWARVAGAAGGVRGADIVRAGRAGCVPRQIFPQP